MSLSIRDGDFNVEEFFLLISLWLSHAFIIPLIVLAKKQKQITLIFATFLNFISSLMYHASYVFNTDKIFLEDLSWHKLSNIGIVTALIIGVIHLMDNKNEEFDEILSYIALLISIIIQEKDPWNFNYALFPFLIAALLGLFKVLNNKHSSIYISSTMLFKGIILIIVGLVFIKFEVDRQSDYLNCYHSGARIIIAVGIFHVMQTQSKTNIEFSLFNVFNSDGFKPKKEF